MKPYTKLAETLTPEGEPLELYSHDGVFYIQSRGVQLMTSFSHFSEEELGRLGCAPFKPARQPNILIGGLGMGYTLRACTETLTQKKAIFTVAEQSPAIIDWNKTHLDPIHPGLLNDPRVNIQAKPVQQLIAQSDGLYNAILLDTDNGPQAFHGKKNESLYNAKGLQKIKAAIKPGGLFALWSVRHHKDFEKLLRKTFPQVTSESVPASHKGKQNKRHTIWICINGYYESKSSKR